MRDTKMLNFLIYKHHLDFNKISRNEEGVFVKTGYGLIQMGHRSNYDFLALPMAFVRLKTHDFVFTRQTL